MLHHFEYPLHNVGLNKCFVDQLKLYIVCSDQIEEVLFDLFESTLPSSSLRFSLC